MFWETHSLLTKLKRVCTNSTLSVSVTICYPSEWEGGKEGSACYKLCCIPQRTAEILTLVPVNVTWFGKKVFAGVIELTWGRIWQACVLSWFSCVQLFVTPWNGARQAPLSMGFSRQEYWNGLPCPSPGEIFLTQGSNQCLLNLLHCRWILYHGATREAPYDERGP